ncbi:hypothetical protein KP509_37G022600 [Ceratopteris richardii]|nr:hypothetical protein KP509_37G022600 [Ceratopteris richardii]
MSIAWQSIDDLHDTLLLSSFSKTLVSNKFTLLRSRKNQSSFALGRFFLQTDTYLNMYFHASDIFQHDFIYQYGAISLSNGLQMSRDGLVQLQINASSFGPGRLTLDYDGNLKMSMWESDISSWTEVGKLIGNGCKLGSPCGPFGICRALPNSSTGVSCSCPPGYQPRIKEDMSQGCESLISYNASCAVQNGSTYITNMVAMEEADYFYNDIDSVRDVDTVACKHLCLQECTCMAASYRNDGVCFLKGNSYGYLLNGLHSMSNTLYMKVVELDSGDQDSHDHRRRVIGLAVSVSFLFVSIIALGSAVWWWRRGPNGIWARKRRSSYGMDGPLKYFEYEELCVATKNFSEQLGEGGYGVVYKGSVSSSVLDNNCTEPALVGREVKVPVAVKMLKGGIAGDEKDLKMELKTLGIVHHVNLVSLLGYSGTKRRRARQNFLVYEFMENGSLDDFLRGYRGDILPWSIRYTIALDAARGIAYLHHECNPPIMHCDIKPQNILLDGHFRAKVADFGLARRFHLDSKHIVKTTIRGTRGYIAPEWLTSRELDVKVDVFSFGMLLLEVVRGFKRTEDSITPLLDWAISSVTEGAVIDHHLHEESRNDDLYQPQILATDTTVSNVHDSHVPEHLRESTQKLRLLKVAIWCLQQNPQRRPGMRHVVEQISGMSAVEDPPLPDLVFGYPVPYPSPSDSSSSTKMYTHSVVSAR